MKASQESLVVLSEVSSEVICGCGIFCLFGETCDDII